MAYDIFSWNWPVWTIFAFSREIFRVCHLQDYILSILAAKNFKWLYVSVCCILPYFTAKISSLSEWIFRIRFDEKLILKRIKSKLYIFPLWSADSFQYLFNHIPKSINFDSNELDYRAKRYTGSSTEIFEQFGYFLKMKLSPWKVWFFMCILLCWNGPYDMDHIIWLRFHYSL